MSDYELSGGQDDFDDFDMDFGDDSFNPDNSSDNRAPIDKAVSGFTTGVYTSATDTGVLSRMMTNALPTTYKDGVQGTTRGVDSIKKQVDEAIGDVKPQLAGMARGMSKMLPEGKLKTLAGKWGDKLSGTGTGDDLASIAEARESEISGVLAGIFDKQNDRDDRKEVISQADRKVDQALSSKQHGESMGQLGMVTTQLTSLVNYQNTVTSQWQRKSLELQYQSMFYLKDLVEDTVKHNLVAKEQRDAMVKNTGLPDYLKLRGIERFKELGRDRLINSALGGLGDYVGKRSENIGSYVFDKLSNIKEGIDKGAEITDSVESVGEMLDDMAENGVDKTEFIAEQGGSQIFELASGIALGWIRNRFEKTEKGKKVTAFGENLKYSAEGIVNDTLDAVSETESSGFVGKAARWLGPLIKDILTYVPGGADLELNNKNSEDVALFDNQTHDTINVVMPHLLSQTVQELRILRTGDDSIGREEFDTTRRVFRTAQDRNASISNFLKNKVSDESRDQKIEQAIDLLLKDKKLSTPARKALKTLLLESPVDALYSGDTQEQIFRLIDLTKESKLNEGNITDPKIVDEIVATFKERNEEVDTFGGEAGQIARQLARTRNQSSDIHEGIQYLLGKYGPEPLLDRKLIEWDGEKYTVAEEGTRALLTGTGSSTVKDTDLNLTNRTLSPVISALIGPPTEGEQPVDEDRSMVIEESLLSIKDTVLNIDRMMVDAVPTEQKITVIDPWPSKDNDLEQTLLLQNILEEVKNVQVNIITADVGEYIDERMKRTKLWTKNLFNEDNVVGRLMNNMLGIATSGAELATGAITGGAGVLSRTGEVLGAGGSLLTEATKAALSGMKNPLGGLAKMGGNLLGSSALLGGMAGKQIFTTVGKAKNAYDESGGVTGLFKSGLRLTTGIMDSVSGQIGDLWRLIPGLGPAVNIIKAGWKSVKGIKGYLKDKVRLFNRPMDINIPGRKDNPVLTAAGMKQGIYYDAKSGEPIRRIGDIRGRVVDSEGNTLLSMEDIQKGLYDALGNRLEGLWGKVKARFKHDKKRIGKFISPITKRLKKGARRLGKIAGKLSPIQIGIDTGGSQEYRQAMLDLGTNQYNVLTDIYGLLDDRLLDQTVAGDLDGTGFRDGSWQDRLLKKRQGLLAKTEKKEEDKKNDPKSAGGLFGMMMGAIGAGASLFSSILTGAGGIGGTILAALGLGGVAKSIKGLMTNNKAPKGGKVSKGKKPPGGKKQPGFLKKLIKKIGLRGALSKLNAAGWLYTSYEAGRYAGDTLRDNVDWIHDIGLTTYDLLHDEDDLINGSPPPPPPSTNWFGGVEEPEIKRTVTTSAKRIAAKVDYKTAPGGLVSPINGPKFIRKGRNVDLDGLHPEIQKNLYSMASEYNALTGKTIQANSGFRSIAHQAKLYREDPSQNARAGHSMHNFRLAVDMQSVDLNELDRMGLLKKYGFTRPVGGETWHLEPIGTQLNREGAKRDMKLAGQMIRSGVGRGGGGIGSTKRTKGDGRDDKLSARIFKAGSAPPNSGKYGETLSTIARGAKDSGVDPTMLQTVGAVESSLDPNAASTASSAKGLFQFTDTTWPETVAKYGGQYGYGTDTSRFDPLANSRMGGAYIKAAFTTLKDSGIANDPGPVEAYLGLFLGPSGSRRFLRHLNDTPDKDATLSFRVQAVANPDIFYSKSGPRTYREIYQLLSTRMENKARNFGITGGAKLTKAAVSRSTVSTLTQDIVTPSTQRTSPIIEDYTPQDNNNLIPNILMESLYTQKIIAAKLDQVIQNTAQPIVVNGKDSTPINAAPEKPKSITSKSVQTMLRNHVPITDAFGTTIL